MLRHVLKLPLCVSEPGNGSVIAHFYLIVMPLSHELFQMLLWFLALGSKHAVLLTLVPTLQAQTMVLLVFEPFLCQRDVGRERIPFMPNSVDNTKQEGSWMPASEELGSPGWAGATVTQQRPGVGAGEGEPMGQRSFREGWKGSPAAMLPKPSCSTQWVLLVSTRDVQGRGNLQVPRQCGKGSVLGTASAAIVPWGGD